jgi:AcrR family transcriptional regulator
MPRTTPADRFDQLIAHATDVFIQQGYRRTQMADVADAMGVAKGTLYLYVESKEALFDLACRHADDAAPLAPPDVLPVPTPPAGATVAYVAARLAQNGMPVSLAAAVERRGTVDVRAELEAIVGELYDVLARNRRGIKLIDRSARDHPELATLWFANTRGGLIALLTRYLDARIRRGLIAPVPDVAAAARLVIETTVFWAVHRHWDAHPQPVDEPTARATVLRMLTRALAAPPQRERTALTASPRPTARRTRGRRL